MSQSLKLQFLGAAGTVTGSKTFIEYNQHHYLMDAGLFQGPKELRDKNWQVLPMLQKIEAVILSHAHIDHSGYLPKLFKDGFRGPIYCTPGTKALCEIMLMDAAHLQEEDARFANRTGYSHHAVALPLYDAEDAKGCLGLFQEVDFHQWKEISPGFSFQFLRAGHIVGSAVTQISFVKNDQQKILCFSGDLGNGRSVILEDRDVVREADYLVLESTYGDRRQERGDIYQQFAEIINKVISRKGTLIIPAFSVGRTQEVLYVIHTLFMQQRIARCPVYIDSPMAQKATHIYLQFHNELKKEISGENIQSVLKDALFRSISDANESMLLCMSTEPKIVISAAGMLTGGRVLHHLKSKLPDDKSGVLFVGYQAQGTKGVLLKNGFKDIRIHHEKISVEAEIFSVDSMSAHADCHDLIKFVSQFSRKPKKILLNHGEVNALDTLRYSLMTDLQIPTEIAQENEIYEII